MSYVHLTPQQAQAISVLARTHKLRRVHVEYSEARPRLLYVSSLGGPHEMRLPPGRCLEGTEAGGPLPRKTRGGDLSRSPHPLHTSSSQSTALSGGSDRHGLRRSAIAVQPRTCCLQPGPDRCWQISKAGNVRLMRS